MNRTEAHLSVTRTESEVREELEEEGFRCDPSGPHTPMTCVKKLGADAAGNSHMAKFTVESELE